MRILLAVILFLMCASISVAQTPDPATLLRQAADMEAEAARIGGEQAAAQIRARALRSMAATIQAEQTRMAIPTATPTPFPTSTPTVMPTMTATPTPTLTPTPTETPIPPTPTRTPAPVVTVGSIGLDSQTLLNFGLGLVIAVCLGVLIVQYARRS